MNNFSVHQLKLNSLKYNELDIDLDAISNIGKDQYGRLTYKGRVLGISNPKLSPLELVFDTDMLILGSELSTSNLYRLEQLSTKRNWIKYQFELRLLTPVDNPSLLVNGNNIHLVDGPIYKEIEYDLDNNELIMYDTSNSLSLRDGSSTTYFVDMTSSYKLFNVTDNITTDIMIQNISDSHFIISPSIIQSGKVYKLYKSRDVFYNTLKSEPVLGDTRVIDFLVSQNIYNLSVKLWMKQ